MPLRLTSGAFRQAGDIPQKYTCDGDNISPPFAWWGVPENRRSFLLICDDPDAPSGIFHHWAAFDIPPRWRGLKEGHGAESLANVFRQANFGKRGYSDPCAPPADKAHRRRAGPNPAHTSSMWPEWSPSYDDLVNSYIPTLRRIGFHVDVELKRNGPRSVTWIAFRRALPWSIPILPWRRASLVMAGLPSCPRSLPMKR
jgi:Raf kinase inhibitor-like YbhB/YbcL family protein